MARVRDNWGKLVQATLQREKLRQIAREDSLSSSTTSSSFRSLLPETPILDIFATSLTYEQIMQATRHFSDENLIKRGHSGDLFIARFQQFPFPVVIKRIDAAATNSEEHFSVELDFFSRVSGHSRFVNLFGNSFKGKDKFLVYRYYSKGDLSKFLFTKPDEHENWLPSLDWNTRLKVAIGAAEGLAYLHHECDPPIAHGDVQASSILLDDDFEVRLGSLSQASPQQNVDFIMVTRRTYTTTGTTIKATCADDVYCFGKVLLELVTGKFGIISSSSDATLNNIVDEELFSEILGQTLPMNTDLIEKVRNMAIVARSCLNRRPPLRPLMRQVLRCLKSS